MAEPPTGGGCALYVPDVLIIRLAYDPPDAFSVSSTGRGELDALMREFDVQEATRLFGNLSDTEAALSRTYLLKLPPDSYVTSGVAAFSEAASVEYAEADYVVHAQGIPNDPFFSTEQWNLRSVRAPEAYDLAVDASDQTLAIIDTGVNLTHEDLKLKMVAGYDFVNDDDDPTDDNGHGSLVAGIAAAGTDNAKGIAGVCPDCRIMPVKALNGNQSGSVSTVVKGIDYAISHGADIINLSLGLPYHSPTLRQAVDRAVNSDIPVVAAVGNDDAAILYPAKYPNVLAVAATQRNGLRGSYSNQGAETDIAAPGGEYAANEMIVSTASNHISDYKGTAGTSMATAHLTGALGMLRALCPDATPNDLRTLLKETASPAGDPSAYGAGHLNVEAALLNASARNISATPSLQDFGTVSVGGSSAVHSFSITNTESGCAGLAIDSATLTGADSDAFAIGNNTCPDRLGAWESCTVEIIFSPLSGEAKDASLVIRSDDPDTPALSIRLTGTGTQHPVISGHVRTESGVGIKGAILDGFPGNPVTEINGYYNVEVGSGWSGNVTPRFGTSSFTPSTRTYADVTGEMAEQNFVTKTPSHTISGHIRHADGSPRRGVILTGLPGDPTTDEDGFYTAQVDYGWSGSVTPQLAYHQFDQPSRTYAAVASDHLEDNYTASLITHTLSGHVRDADGTPVDGVVLEGGPDGPVSTDQNGHYTLEVAFGWIGTLRPSRPSYTFVPADCTYTHVTTATGGQNYRAVRIPGVACDASTIRSDGSGDWNDPNTWMPKRMPRWDDIVDIRADDTVTITSSAEIRVKGLCNAGALISTSDAEIRITGEDFIYNQGRIWGGDGMNGSDGMSVLLTGRQTVYNARTGDIQAGRGGNHYGWTARAGDGGSVETYGDTIINQGIIGPECDSDAPESDGGNGGDSLTPHGPGTTCGGSHGGNGGNTILLANTLLINTGSGRIATGGGGDANYGHCSPYPGSGGNIVFSAPATIQNGTIVGCGTGGKFSWDPSIAMTGSNARWHSDTIKIYGGENWTLDLRQLSEGAMVAADTITIGVGKCSVIDLRGTAKGAIQGRTVEIFADTILLDERVRLSEIISSPNLQVRPPKILYDFLIKIPKRLVRGPSEEIAFFDLFVLNNSPVEDAYTLKVTDAKGHELNVHAYQTFKVDALNKTSLALNVMLPSLVGASENLTLTITSHGDPDLVRQANMRIVSSEASEEVPTDSDNDGLSDADEATYETDPASPDTDGDGMKDGWEAAHGLDPLVDDASADPDGDGYANIEEYEAGADPNASDRIDFESVPETLPSDGLEIGDLFRPLYGIAFRLDTDMDGFPDDDAFPVLEKIGDADPNPGFLNEFLDADDVAAQGYESQLGEFFMTIDGVCGNVIIIYDTPVSAASAQIWDIDGDERLTEQWLVEAMGSGYASGEDDVLESILTPLGDDLEGDGKPWSWSFEHETADIHAIRISFAGSDSDPDMAFDNFAPSALPPTPRFEGGLFTVGDDGLVVIDWLYDGGAYQGELGIFSLSGMEYLAADAFRKEAAKRALSGTPQGYVVISDGTEGARYRGFLGEACERNGGRYNGVKRFRMVPRDRFATVLIPNGTLQAYHDHMETDPEKRPLFSLTAMHSDHGIRLGQIADVNGLGNAFVYEDMDLDDPLNDKDYNDFIIQVTGATPEGIPSLDALVSRDKKGRKKRDDRGWFDWRRETPLGRLIIEHIESSAMETTDQWFTVTLDASAELAAYDSENRGCGGDGCHIPGAILELRDDGQQRIDLPAWKAADYRAVIRSAEDGEALLAVTHPLNEGSSEDSETVMLGAHETLVTDVAVYDAGDGLGIDVGQADESPAGPYDFDGSGRIDDTDIEAVSALWNVCQGDEGYLPFYDLDDDGCVTILDIMRVVNSR